MAGLGSFACIFVLKHTLYILCLIIRLHSFSQYSNVSESFICAHLRFSFIRNWRYIYEDSSWSSIKHRHIQRVITSFHHGIDIDEISCPWKNTRAHAALCAHILFLAMTVFQYVYICVSTKNLFEYVIIIIIQLKSYYVCTQRLWLNTKSRQVLFGTYMIKANNTKDFNGQKTTNLTKKDLMIRLLCSLLYCK